MKTVSEINVVWTRQDDGSHTCAARGFEIAKAGRAGRGWSLTTNGRFVGLYPTLRQAKAFAASVASSKAHADRFMAAHDGIAGGRSAISKEKS